MSLLSNIFRERKLQRMQKQLLPEHRELLTDKEFNDYDTLLKFQYWCTEDVEVPWEVFRDNYVHLCDICHIWDTHQCICYTR